MLGSWLRSATGVLLVCVLAACGGSGSSGSSSGASSSGASSSGASSGGQPPPGEMNALVDPLYQQVSDLNLPDAWEAALLARLGAVSGALDDDQACVASDSVLEALGDLASWQEGADSAQAGALEDLYEDLLRLRVPVMGQRPAGEGCGGGGTVAIDTSLESRDGTLEALDDGPERPVAAMVTSRGVQTDFVEDELLVVSDDTDAVEEFAERWGGTVVDVAVGDDGRIYALVRVGDLEIDPHQLPDLLATLRPGVTEAVAVSSARARQLLAVAALEAANGLEVGFNPVGEGGGVAAGATADSLTLDPGPGFSWTPDGIWSPNAFDWIHYRADSVQGIGVPEAWRLLNTLGLLEPASVTIGIIDMGFLNVDMPPGTQYRSTAAGADGLGTSNRYQCSGGNPCPWHGTMVAQAAGGELNNGFGAAGTGAPVARLVNVYTLYDAWSALAGMDAARNNGASVINMSFSNRVPSIFDWGLAVSRGYTANLEGPVLVASAGNSNENVDGLECFLGSCWEAHFIWPCESERVICVGGLEHNSLARDIDSNYGDPGQSDNTVDIFAPFFGLVAGNNASVNWATLGGGTSYAAPYLAGVVALMQAANPGLSKNELTQILFDTSRPGAPGFPEVHRVVNALAAVKKVSPPLIRLQGFALDHGNQVPLNRNFVLTPNVYWEGNLCPLSQCPVTWSHTPQSVASSGATFRFTNEGFVTIIATATLPSGLNINTSVTLEVVNEAPTAIVVEPAQDAVVYVGQTVNFIGYGLDPNEGPGPGDGMLNTGCEWRDFPVGGADDADSGTMTSCTTSKVFTIPGHRVVSLQVTDPQGAASAWVYTDIYVEPAPAVPGPNATLGISAPNYADNTYGRDLPITFAMSTPGNGNPPYNYQLRLTSYQEGSTTAVYQTGLIRNVTLPGTSSNYSWTPDHSPSLILPENGHDCFFQGQWMRVTLTVRDMDGNPGSSASVLFRVRCRFV